jgi:3-deoxy-D-manno-octulosonate 8-phosphate phosphatase (KDO 8-P phosphatase)
MRFDAQVLGRAARVELAIFDVDGVLTDGSIVIGPDGQEFKHFDVRDGLGLVMLRDSGVALAVITGRQSPAVARRMAELGIDLVFQGQSNKAAALDILLSSLELDADAVCYVGDDLPDVPVMRRVGLPIAVADADQQLHKFAVYRTQANGGRGAAREVCELIMTAKGSLVAQLARFDIVGHHSSTGV